MKSIIITIFIVGGSVFAASTYFAVSRDSIAQTAKVPETEVVESPIESTLVTEPVSEPSIPDKLRRKIEATAIESHPDDPSKQLVVVKEQTMAYRELESFNRPDNIPENVFQSVSRNAAESHVDDYASQLAVIKDQLKGYRQLNSFVRPDDVPHTMIGAIARKAVESHQTTSPNNSI